MKHIALSSLILAGTLFGFGTAASAASPLLPAEPPLACGGTLSDNCNGIELVQSGCAAAAAAVARQMGGEVIGAPRTVQRGGQTFCEVTVLIHDPSGRSPPRRERVVVPAR